MTSKRKILIGALGLGIFLSVGFGSAVSSLTAKAEKCEIPSFTMSGASVRFRQDVKIDDSGIRFSSRIATSEYENLEAFGEIQSIGMAVLPSDLLGQDVLSKDTTDALVIEVKNDEMDVRNLVEVDGVEYYEFRTYIYGIPKEAYSRALATTSYICVNVGDEDVYFYSDKISRSIAGVSKSALQDVKDEQTEEYGYEIGEGEVGEKGKFSPYSAEQRASLDEYLYAKVSFNTDGAGTKESQSVKLGSHVLMPTDVEKNGYVLTGWVSLEDGEETPFDFDTDVITKDTTLKAVWKIACGQYFVSDRQPISVEDNKTCGIPKIKGTRLEGEQKAVFEYKDVIALNSFSGTLIEFTADKIDDSFGGTVATVRLVDVADSTNAVELTFDCTEDFKSYIRYNGSTLVDGFDESYCGYSLTGVRGDNYSIGATNTVKATYDYRTGTVSIGNARTKVSLDGFEHGAKLCVCLGSARTALVVSMVANTRLYPPIDGGKYFKTDYQAISVEDDKTCGMPSTKGTRIEGEKNSCFEYKETIDMSAFDGTLIAFTADKVNDEYLGKVVSIRLTDVNDEKNVIELTFDCTEDFKSIVKYKGNVVAESEEETENWNRYSLIGSYAMPLDWPASQLVPATYDSSTKTVSIGATQATLTNLVGFEDGAKLSVCLGSERTALVIGTVNNTPLAK